MPNFENEAKPSGCCREGIRRRNYLPFAISLSILLSIAMIFSAGCNDRKPQAPPQALEVDEENAFQILKEVIAFGNRPSGSSNAAMLVEYIKQRCIEYGYSPIVDEWDQQTPKGKTTFRNVYADLPGTSNEIILIGSHYDTKHLPHVPDFVGANDGGSSTALLLEIMRVLGTLRNRQGPTLKFAFFDGEEAVEAYSDVDGLYGSRHLARSIKDAGESERYKAVIIIDMIGDRDLTVTLLPDDDPNLVKKLLKISKDLNARQHFGFFLRGTIIDDHVPFKKLGIPAIDIIDLDYGPNNSYWHTNQDTIDKLSAASLGIIGRATVQLILEL